MNKVLGVKLKNFRCHEDFELDCLQSTTMIVGENGSGKTSILEAIYLALRGKSFKGVDREILRRGADFYRAEILLADAQKVVIRFDGLKKSLRLPKKYRYPVVLFEPDDLHLVGSSPSRRRDYFDEFFKQIDANYGVALSRYTKALKQRNDLLKEEMVSRDALFSWNVLLAHYGTEVLRRRIEGLAKINALLTENYRGIAKNEDECSLEYLGEKNLSENRYMEILERNFERDSLLGYTSFGVHRDDFEFVFNGEKADGSASRGEIRSIVLALKFIEAEVLERELNKKPVVLLDDIFSELDDMRQQHLIENFKDYQMIVTSTNALRGIDGELLNL